MVQLFTKWRFLFTATRHYFTFFQDACRFSFFSMSPKNSILIMNLFVVLVLALVGCSNQNTNTSSAVTANNPVSSSAAAINLNISAASSLTDAIKAINALYREAKPNIAITANFASSGTLQTQIENGAPVDIFISAAAAQMDNLQKKGILLNETRQNLLNNKVVLIVPADSNLAINSFAGLGADDIKKIAIGDPNSVPAGAYAVQVFDELGITAEIQPKEVLASDARQVLTYVEGGNVDVGIVYSTDALISTRVKVAAIAPSDINAKIVYPVGIIKASKNPNAAKDYVSFLFGAQAKAVFEKYGFSLAAQ
jgi:molybdate transport system substrate-binding protein